MYEHGGHVNHTLIHPRKSAATRRRSVGILAAVSSIAVVAVMVVAAPAWASTTTLAPNSITTTAGKVGSGQTVSNLVAKDQSGTQNNWAKYVEFSPKNGSAYNGYRSYTLPGSVTPSSVTSIAVTVNYAGPATSSQTWTWSLYNWTTSSWTTVGTNATAPDWGAWKTLSFASPSSASSHVSSSGQVRVRVLASNASDSADIDYESVLVTHSAGGSDTTAPSTPTGLSVTGTTSSSVSLSWNASTDNVGVAGYEVFQGSSTTPVASPAGTSATVSGLAASTAYSFTVKSFDAAGNRSAASASVTGTTTAATVGTVVLPTANAQFDYQIGGAYTPLASVGIVDRDRLAAPAPGKYNICYVNLMQTQPDETGQSQSNPPYGTTQWWKNNHFSALLPDESTSDPTDVVTDVAWDEVVFDLRTSAKRTALFDIQKPWLDQCKMDGFDAIEPDNLDTYTRSTDKAGHQMMTFNDNVAYLKMVVPYAHSLGLAVAQKNVNSEFTDWKVSTGRDGRNFVDTVSPAQGFDFAIAEECQAYKECGEYTAVYGNLVYEIEYTDNNKNQTIGGVTKKAYQWACIDRGPTMSVILRDRNVTPSSAGAYYYEWC